jgi:RimJ/RimL family protein N-acetyltransferase
MTSTLLARGERVSLRPTTDDDLSFVLSAEGQTDLVRHWSRERHREAMAAPSEAHWVVRTTLHARRVGYVILTGLGTPDRSVALQRIVIHEPGRGFGRDSLRLIKRLAFGPLGAHRLWLDVMDHNQRARALYLSEGFVPEGTLRECLSLGDRFVSLEILSILEQEHARAGSMAPLRAARPNGKLRGRPQNSIPSSLHGEVRRGGR